ncbi:hypothetical protein [Raoultibacter timonensis]|uniref:hypothetical protein n=1 Tax=Raoultibacter timonensis TaxID=1907662 RepID=UPI0015E15D08|nr:hypothetical protein [Raoultibacter timonensis]
MSKVKPRGRTIRCDGFVEADLSALRFCDMPDGEGEMLKTTAGFFELAATRDARVA